MSNLDFEKNPLNRPAFRHDLIEGETPVLRTWPEWQEIHTRLEQALAQRLRVYMGPSDTPRGTPPDGGQRRDGQVDIVLNGSVV